MIFYFIIEDLFRILSIQFLQNFFHTLYHMDTGISNAASNVPNHA